MHARVCVCRRARAVLIYFLSLLERPAAEAQCFISDDLAAATLSPFLLTSQLASVLLSQQ